MVHFGMSAPDVEAALTQLGPKDPAELSAWWDEYQSQAWDDQMARDVRAGRFGPLLQRVREQFEAGQCRTL